MVWLLPPPPPASLVDLQHTEKLRKRDACWWGGGSGGGRSQIIRRRESLVVYYALNTLCILVFRVFIRLNFWSAKRRALRSKHSMHKYSTFNSGSLIFRKEVDCRNACLWIWSFCGDCSSARTNKTRSILCIKGTVDGLYYTQSTRVSVPSSELAPPAPFPASEWTHCGGGNTRLPVRGWGGGANLDDWRKSPALCLFCERDSAWLKMNVFEDLKNYINTHSVCALMVLRSLNSIFYAINL